MAWLWAIGAVCFFLAGLMVVSAVGVTRRDERADSGGASRITAMLGLGFGAALLGLIGLAFVMTANSDFGR